MKLLLPWYIGERLTCEVTPQSQSFRLRRKSVLDAGKEHLHHVPAQVGGKKGVYFIERRSWFDLFTGLSPVRVNLKAFACKRNG